MKFQYKNDLITINTSDDLCVEFAAYCPEDYYAQEIEEIRLEGDEVLEAAWYGTYVRIGEKHYALAALAGLALDWYQEFLDGCKDEDEAEERHRMELGSAEKSGRV